MSDDPADPGLAALAAAAAAARVDVVTLAAPPAPDRSQKVANLDAGCAAAAAWGAGLALCADDDVALHPGSLGCLAAALSACESAPLATGYSLDAVPVGGSLAARAAAAYHLPLLLVFPVPGGMVAW